MALRRAPRPRAHPGCGLAGRMATGWWALPLPLLVLMLAGTCAAAPPVLQGAPTALPGPQLRLAIGPSASMVYGPRRLAAPQLLPDPQAAAVPPSLGLEFRAPAASREGPRALLRVQLSGDAALQFRPRRRGIAVSYRAEF